MRFKKLIILFLSVLFSGSVAYCQNVKEKPADSQQVFFGKYAVGTTSEVSIAEILKSDSLFMPAVKGVVPSKVVSFDVYIFKDRRGIAETALGNRLSKKQKALISNLVPGDVLYIQKILVKYPGKNKVALNSKFTFKIKR